MVRKEDKRRPVRNERAGTARPEWSGRGRWSLLVTFTTGVRNSAVKQTAVRTGTALVTASDCPALVDIHREKARTRVAPAP